MKFSIWVKVNAVVARSCPIAITIDRRNIDGEKPKGAINVKNWTKGFLKLVGRSLVKDFAKIDQGLPRLLFVFGFDFESFSIGL